MTQQRVHIKPNVIKPGHVGTLGDMMKSMDTGLEPRQPAAALVITVDEPLEQPVAAMPYDLSQMTAEWAGIPYAELSVLLVNLRYLQTMHQTHHWVARGDSFYGDHLLFERLYNDATEEVDSLAEKLVGLGTEKNVDLYMQMKQLGKLISSRYGQIAIPNPFELLQFSLEGERDFVKMVLQVRDMLDSNGQLSYGLDNHLAGLADAHESHIYLLRQRCGNRDELV